MKMRVAGGVLLSLMAMGCKPEADRIRDLENKAAEQQQPAQPPMPDQVARVGVGVKGDSLDDIKDDDPRMLIAGPAKAYFKVKEKIVFEVQLPHTERAFEALNGRHPKSHEEYMREIVGQIKLPQLPKGMIYRYHPDTNELWVEAEKKE